MNINRHYSIPASLSLLAHNSCACDYLCSCINCQWYKCLASIGHLNYSAHKYLMVKLSFMFYLQNICHVCPGNLHFNTSPLLFKILISSGRYTGMRCAINDIHYRQQKRNKVEENYFTTTRQRWHIKTRHIFRPGSSK